MLGHSLGGIWQTYDRHDYMKEQATAYEAWCKRLFGLVGIHEPTTPANDNVVTINSRRTA